MDKHIFINHFLSKELFCKDYMVIILNVLILKIFLLKIRIGYCVLLCI